MPAKSQVGRMLAAASSLNLKMTVLRSRPTACTSIPRLLRLLVVTSLSSSLIVFVANHSRDEETSYGAHSSLAPSVCVLLTTAWSADFGAASDSSPGEVANH